MTLIHLKTSLEEIRGQRIEVIIFYDSSFSENLDSWSKNFEVIFKHTVKVLNKLIDKVGRYPANTTPTHKLNLVFVYGSKYPVASVGCSSYEDHSKNKFAQVTLRFNFARTDSGVEGKSAITHELLHPISQAHENESYLKLECRRQMREFVAVEADWDREIKLVSQQYFDLIKSHVKINFNEFYRKYFAMGEKLRKKFHNTFADAGLAIVGLRLNAFDFLETEIKFDENRVNEALVLMREFAMLKVQMNSIGVSENKYEAIVQFVGYVIAIYTLPVHAIALRYVDFDDYAIRAGFSERQKVRLKAMSTKLDEVIAMQQRVRYQYMRTKTKSLFDEFLNNYLVAIEQLVHDDVLYRDISSGKEMENVIFHSSKLVAIKQAQFVFFNQYKTLLNSMKG
jgi:hypothetical protein